jgi:hypothetical protein
MTEPTPASTGHGRIWLRKAHNYAGLYLLFFVWLFSLTGLLLNHPGWSIAQFWPKRRETTSQASLTPMAPAADLTMATELMRRLWITGEIGETTRSRDGKRFVFQVVKPGRIVRVEAQFDDPRVRITTIDLRWRIRAGRVRIRVAQFCLTDVAIVIYCPYSR